MALFQDEEMIQALVMHRFLKPFAYGVGIRRCYWCFQYLDPRPGSDASKLDAIFTIVIPNQILGTLTKRRGFPELLGPYHPKTSSKG